MLLNKFLTRKGWRVVAHSTLATAGIGLLYLLSKMVIGDIQQENTFSWPLFGVGMVFSLWLIALGSMLLKAELTDWK
jgi:F0F1-type ATP synthase membrane subunit c/vacuolar-type H+-ATPase subunit K